MVKSPDTTNSSKPPDNPPGAHCIQTGSHTPLPVIYKVPSNSVVSINSLAHGILIN